MPGEADYYDLLQLNRSATDRDIRLSYRKLALKHHPLRNNGPESAILFHRISEAFDVLSSVEKRSVYDLYGRKGLEEGVQGNNLEEYKGGYMFSEKRSFEVFETFFGTSNPFEAVFAPIKDSEMTHENRELYRNPDYPKVEVALEDLYNGCQKNVTRSVNIIENGVVKSVKKEFRINIRKGWRDNMKIVIPKQGDQYPNGFVDDAIFLLCQQKHEYFTREGDDLHMTVKITLREALTETNLRLRTLDGRELNLIVSDIISPIYQKTVSNEGMPKDERGEHYGDLHLHFDIDFPAYLKQSQKEMISKVLQQE